MDIPVSEEKMEKWDEVQLKRRPPVQKFFPELTAEQREFILSGITPSEWKEWVLGKKEPERKN